MKQITIAEYLEDGEPGPKKICPWCEQRIRPLNKHGMDAAKLAVLDCMGRLHGRVVSSYLPGPVPEAFQWIRVDEGWDIYCDKFIIRSPEYRVGAHVQRLAYFGLVDHIGPRRALYRVNAAGYGFLRGLVSVPFKIWCRDGEVLERTKETITAPQIDFRLDKHYWDHCWWEQRHKTELHGPSYEGSES